MVVQPQWARHVSVGGVLTQEEYEQSGGHEFDYPIVRPADFFIASYNTLASGTAQSDGTCGATHGEVVINNAIGSLPAVGGRILCSSGTLYLGSPILFTGTACDHTTIEGQGWSTVLTLSSSSNCDMIQGSGSVTSYVTIANLRVNGNNSGNTSGNGISGLFYRSIFHNLYIGNTADDGILLGDGTATCSYNKIRFCHITTLGKYGIELKYQTDETTVLGCRVYGGTQSGIAIDTSSIGVFYSQISTNINHGIIVGTANSVTGLQVIGNSITNNYKDGINIDTRSLYSSVIAGNKFSSNNRGTAGNSSFYVHIGSPYQFSRNSITGNTFDGSGTAVYNIAISTDTNLFIRNYVGGNTFYGGSTSQVYLSPTTVGSFNVLESNAGYVFPGEEKSVAGSLTAGSADSFTFYWQNPEASQIVIKELQVYVSTAGGSGALLNAGTATTSSTSSSNLIGSGDLNSVGFLVSTSRFVLAASGGAADYITGQIVGADALTLAGSYYIKYQGA